jgi:hypothetical protein
MISVLLIEMIRYMFFIVIQVFRYFLQSTNSHVSVKRFRYKEVLQKIEELYLITVHSKKKPVNERSPSLVHVVSLACSLMFLLHPPCLFEVIAQC